MENRIPYFIITDGRTWIVYNIEKPGGEPILKIDIVSEPIEEVVRKLLSLWRPLLHRGIKIVEPVTRPQWRVSKEEVEAREEYTEELFRGPITWKKAEILVLYVLYKSNKPLRRKEIVDIVRRKVKFVKRDKELVKSGKPRWEATVRWAISNLGKKGLLEKVEREVWRITDKGILRLKQEVIKST